MRETTSTGLARRARHARPVGWLGLSAWLAWSCAQPSAADAQSVPPPAPRSTQPLAAPTWQPLAAAKSNAQPHAAGLSPDYLWFTASASLLSLSLAGLFALRVHSLYDQASALPGVSPERLALRGQTERAEVTADLLFGSAAAFALSSAILALFTDWDHASERPTRTHAALQLVPIAGRGGAHLMLRGVLP